MFSLFDKTEISQRRSSWPSEERILEILHGEDPSPPTPRPLPYSEFGKQNKVHVSIMQIYILFHAPSKLIVDLFP